MPDQRHPPVAARQGHGRIGDPCQFVHQDAGRAADGRHVARHRHGVSPVPLKVIADGDIACAGERQREAFHQLA